MHYRSDSRSTIVSFTILSCRDDALWPTSVGLSLDRSIFDPWETIPVGLDAYYARPRGRLYVTERLNHVLVLYDRQGLLLKKWCFWANVQYDDS